CSRSSWSGIGRTGLNSAGGGAGDLRDTGDRCTTRRGDDMTTHSKSDKDSDPTRVGMPRDREDEWLKALEAALSDIKSLDESPPLVPSQEEGAAKPSEFAAKPVNRVRHERRAIERVRTDDRVNIRSKAPPWRGAPSWPFNDRQGRDPDGRPVEGPHDQHH